jgi:hypothetical protein
MPDVDGEEDLESLTPVERAQLREIIESGRVTEVSEDVRAFIEKEMPDLAEKLPPRVKH